MNKVDRYLLRGLNRYADAVKPVATAAARELFLGHPVVCCEFFTPPATASLFRRAMRFAKRKLGFDLEARRDLHETWPQSWRY
jgi:hypothetical protein